MKISRHWYRIALATLASAALMATFGACSMPSAPTDRYAIVIGIAHYLDSNSIADCSYAENDAAALGTKLAAKGWTVYDSLISSVSSESFPPYTTSVTTTSVLPYKANIKAALQNFALAHPNASSVLFYYSGHGTQIGKDAYICPYDTRYLSSGNLDTSYLISVSELDAWVNGSGSTNKLVILDSCYSGGFVPSTLSIDATPGAYLPATTSGSVNGAISTALANAGALFSQAISDRSDPSIMTISASGWNEESYSDVYSVVSPSSDPHGVFTWFFLEAASNADINGDRLVSATEAFGYARSKILAIWDANGSNIYQNATFLPHISGGSGDIVLYDNR